MHTLISSPMDLAMFLIGIVLCIVSAVVLLVILGVIGAFVYGSIRYSPAIIRELRARGAKPSAK